MKQINFDEELSKNEWKEKRKKILKRDRFKCAICGCDYKTLNIHHLKYFSDREYWDYPNELLVTVCRDCHQKIHGKKEGELKRPLSVVAEEIKQKTIPQMQKVHVEIEENYNRRPTIYINGEKSIVYTKSMKSHRNGLTFKLKNARGKEKDIARKDLSRLSELGLITDRTYGDLYVLEDIFTNGKLKVN